ncbi:AraC family transcriptional regulator [Companilactobacillus heilongjiangensis]|uniref:AraC family transcriptional regulator n=1 Tax=Companilactobacillus heilongjiangensis TaxID=1074467 RepID=A0A0K2LB78_9LACO|nr:AraC family transcriptional regulator [Companilactobacillus heilongjiangensis]ALB28549.1 AraC family transcriptional regulator [Companilactobacillus heilongjiangensis]
MLKEFNALMDYIEQNITEDISDEKIAKIVGTSGYQFRRMFSYLAGMTLNEYIKYRRLSLANIDLVNGDRVTDVAYKYQYQSIDGFTRAFKDWSGFLPSEVMKNRVQKTLPKFSFFIDIKGGNTLDYKIKQMPKFNIIGVSKRVPVQFEGVNNEIVALAQSISQTQREEMHQLANLELNRPLNVSYDFDVDYLQEKGQLTHMIGMATTKENNFSDLESLEIPANTWAVFSVRGDFPQAMQETNARIYSEWLPSSNYELIELPNFSITDYKPDNKDVYSEIWIPIKKVN